METPASREEPTVDTFPRQSARTQRFTLGAPRDFTVAPDGSRVAFLRSAGPEDPVTALWVLDLPDGDERCVADPRALLPSGAGDLPAEERARRERAREAAEGFTAYACDAEARIATAALAGQLVVVDLASGAAHVVPTPTVVIDPRPDPTGTRVAWVDGRALWVAELADPGSARPVAAEEADDVRWGVAEFAAAEEMDRHRGFWWAPDGQTLLVARVDDAGVPRWWIADPARPDVAPTGVRYPAAGEANSEVSLWLVGVTDDRRVEVPWDRETLPYLVHAAWDDHGPIVALQPRDQRSIDVRAVDPATGGSHTIWTDSDASWVERVPGTPARLADGRVVMGSDASGTRRLVVGDQPVSPPDWSVRAVVSVGDHDVFFTANPLDDATGLQVWRWATGSLEQISRGPGLHTAVAAGRTLVLRSESLESSEPQVGVLTPPSAGSGAPGHPVLREIRSRSAAPLVAPRPQISHLGARRLATALLLPQQMDPGERLPVLLDPYGGPHAQRVVQSQRAFCVSQWFADQGFAVVVVDGRGTPGRGAAWEREIRGDLGTAPLEDQIAGLELLAEAGAPLDLSRVAIRGWSFGGYLAALAALRHPEIFHAAIVGAPVTDWSLYDTFYTERYLGHPAEEPEAYARSSLLGSVHRGAAPMLVIHGLADDNVVAAHTLRLSAELLAVGRAHQVLPLTGVTHMASQEVVAENLLLLQLEFLREALGVACEVPGGTGHLHRVGPEGFEPP